MSNGQAQHAALADRARFVVSGAVAALLVLVALWELSGGVSSRSLLLAVLFTSPLWLALPRLVRGHRHTYAWMTLATVPYLVLGVTEAIANPPMRVWAGLCLTLAFVVFVGLVAYLRMSK